MSAPCENCGSHIRVCADCDFYKGKYISIPDNATNGDIIKIMFPAMRTYVEGGVIKANIHTQFDIDWWNRPYKKGKQV